MTTNELLERMTIGVCLSGQFKVTIEFRGKQYSCKSNNTQAYDAVRDYLRGTDEPSWGYTPKQAALALWNECKFENGLK